MYLSTTLSAISQHIGEHQLFRLYVMFKLQRHFLLSFLVGFGCICVNFFFVKNTLIMKDFEFIVWFWCVVCFCLSSPPTLICLTLALVWIWSVKVEGQNVDEKKKIALTIHSQANKQQFYVPHIIQVHSTPRMNFIFFRRCQLLDLLTGFLFVRLGLFKLILYD